MKRFVFTSLLSAVLMLPAAFGQADIRANKQQKRINQGVRSGELTPNEAAKLERNQARINRQKRRQRAENGGTLTPAQKAKINREQNRQSNKIYKDKHNGRAQ